MEEVVIKVEPVFFDGEETPENKEQPRIKEEILDDENLPDPLQSKEADEENSESLTGTGVSSSFVKHKRGKPLKGVEKVIVLNVFDKFSEKLPTLTIQEIVRLTAEFTGVSATSIFSARKERSERGKLSTPGKKRKREKTVLGKCDDFIKSSIRRKVHQFFLENEPPTIDKVLEAVNDDTDLPNFKRTSFHTLLKDIGFEFVRRSWKSVITDSQDIILCRRDYLKRIRSYREEGRKLYYLDEMWISEHHANPKGRIDSTVKSRKQTPLLGLNSEIKNSTRKRKGLIIIHVGSEDGFVNESALIIESNKGGNFHDELTAEIFQNWFESILSKLAPNSVIVMDNAPSHSVKIEHTGTPNTSWQKDDIISWLQRKNIPCDVSMVKAELLTLVKKAGNDVTKYVVDCLAEKAGQTVARLPLYHSNLNPIELVWAQVKEYVASNNKVIKFRDLRCLVELALNQITADKWCSCIEQVIKEEMMMWDLDGITDVILDKLVINAPGSEHSSDTDSDVEGIEPSSSSD